jgi:Protein of unknown function (DUF1036)
MALYFKNKTNELLWVAYAYHAPGCEGGVNWAKKGWWSIPPGMTVKVRSGYVGGQKFFFFAEADDFSPVWTGPFTTHLPWQAFDWCWTTGSTNGRILGMRKILTSVLNWDYIVGLVK